MPCTDNHDDAENIARLVRALKDRPGALLPILHGVQQELGHVPLKAVPIIAEELNLTRAEVHGVISFYHDFRSKPSGRHIVRICQAESCQAMGSGPLTAYAKKHLGVDFHDTTGDEAFTLEPVYCLGNCACSPAIMVDEEIYGRVTPERLQEILQEATRSEA
jgi:formate dehydrogenase subunit gamma